MKLSKYSFGLIYKEKDSEVLNKLKIFLSLDFKTKLILLEAYYFLGVGRYLKSVPFSKLATMLGEHMKETTYDLKADKQILRNISQSIKIMSPYTFWESQCLVQAIAAMKMLEKRNIECTLYLGTAKEESGELIAHAWLRSGSLFITGFEGKDKFTVVGKFAKTIGGTVNE
ncbi:lasso peptide biosynthesis B2 protein [Metabacillus litoralis]|uniref:lasso peptide biosynthesis B2 protein n=1 Tax=Metabacillus litoralis TaxID=152268 RepID=UPI001CFDB8D6|nr:lasso peptide biosynthesis B2 protein [Metabacillus litoralis]